MSRYNVNREYDTLQDIAKQQLQKEFEQSPSELKKKIDKLYDVVKILTQEVSLLKKQISEFKKEEKLAIEYSKKQE